MKHFSNYKYPIFSFLFSLFSMLVYSQAFVDINAGVTGVLNGSAAWGDYDNDKDLDLLIAGETGGGSYVTSIYQNNDGNFTNINAGLTGITRGSVCWGDYDNDGDLDILMTGGNAEGRSLIYRNDDGVFTSLQLEMEYFGEFSFASWADYDNDGDLDVFVTGNWSSKLYINEGADIFSDSELAFVMLSSGKSNWGDIDGDGDLDLFLTGDTGGGMKLYLYINEHDSFTETELTGMGLSAGSVEPGDYDSDGDLDILIMGFNDNVEPAANIYRNDGNLIFTNIYTGLSPVAMGRAAWGDMDNDGDLDVAFTGKLAGCGVIVSEIFENEGNDIFNSINSGITDSEYSYLAWGDYDNDTDLDLLLCGDIYNGGAFAKIYRNDISLPNFIPEPPQNLSVDFANEYATLSWDAGSDIQTPAEGLMYNIRIGTEPLNCNLWSPMAYMEDGFRKLPISGNTTLSNSWKVYGLEEGQTYYWSVQTIDNTFAGSEFSEEHSFMVTFTGLNQNTNVQNATSFFPNPATEIIYFKNKFDSNTSIQIYSVTGELVDEVLVTNINSIDISNLKKGVYFLHSQTNGENLITKLVKK